MSETPRKPQSTAEAFDDLSTEISALGESVVKALRLRELAARYPRIAANGLNIVGVVLLCMAGVFLYRGEYGGAVFHAGLAVVLPLFRIRSKQ